MPKIVDHDQRREFIARVSAEIIAEQGLDQATIREIAQRTGFSKGVIEHYFDDKDHIIDMAIDWINERFVQREKKATNGKSGLAALEARLDCALPVTKESLREWKIRLRFWSDAAVRNELHSLQSERLGKTRERFTKDLEEAKQLGELRDQIDSTHAANMLIHFVCGVSANALIAPNYYNRRYMKQLVQDVIGDMRNQRGNTLLLHGRGVPH
jgi:AcrR family transcriptional regulator